MCSKKMQRLFLGNIFFISRTRGCLIFISGEVVAVSCWVFKAGKVWNSFIVVVILEVFLLLLFSLV